MAGEIITCDMDQHKALEHFLNQTSQKKQKWKPNLATDRVFSIRPVKLNVRMNIDGSNRCTRRCFFTQLNVLSLYWGKLVRGPQICLGTNHRPLDHMIFKCKTLSTANSKCYSSKYSKSVSGLDTLSMAVPFLAT